MCVRACLAMAIARMAFCSLRYVVNQALSAVIESQRRPTGSSLHALLGAVRERAVTRKRKPRRTSPLAKHILLMANTARAAMPTSMLKSATVYSVEQNCMLSERIMAS